MQILFSENESLKLRTEPRFKQSLGQLEPWHTKLNQRKTLFCLCLKLGKDYKVNERGVSQRLRLPNIWVSEELPENHAVAIIFYYDQNWIFKDTLLELHQASWPLTNNIGGRLDSDKPRLFFNDIEKSSADADQTVA